jgi:thioredoxin reductase-like selenoprotein T
MDRVQLVLLGLPILLFCSDLVTLFAPQPPSAPNPNHHPDGALPDDPSAADASAQVVAVPSRPVQS